MAARREQQETPAEHGRGLDVPHNPASEMAVLGAILQTAQDDTTRAATLLADAPRPSDYYRPAHETLAAHLDAAANSGGAIDPAAILTRLQDAGDLRGGVLDGPYLHRLIEVSCPPSSIAWHTDVIARLARRRREIGVLQHALQRISSADPEDEGAAWEAMADLEDLTTGRGRAELTIETIDDVLAGDEDEDYDWLIPGLLERMDRLIITGPEGGGKSTFLRQLAIQSAAGIHPFGKESYRPLRVMLVDLENSRRQFRRAARPLRIQAGKHLEADRLHVTIRTEGLDLTSAGDVTWLERHVAASRPDILITGPIYKMANGDPTEEQSAKPVATVLDRIRAQFGCAVILEAHSAKALGGAKKRAHEPYGWSGWLRWPEFGIWLSADGDIEHFRGMRDEREWPGILQRGGEWPWTVGASESAIRWSRIRQCVLDEGRMLSNREIARRTEIPDTTLRRVLGEFAMQYAALKAQVESEPDDAE